MLLLAALILLQVAPAPSSDREFVKQCLGTDRFYAPIEKLAASRQSLGEDGWRSACAQAREIDVKRRAIIEKVLQGAEAPAGYASSVRFVALAKAARDPEVAALFHHVAREQAARLSMLPQAKAVFAPGASAAVLQLSDGLVSYDAVAADAENREWLKAVLARRGWFIISRDGADADSAAWLIVQHGDMDRDFQRSVVKMLEPLAEKGESSPQALTALKMRVIQPAAN
jgi:hypothetical protein